MGRGEGIKSGSVKGPHMRKIAVTALFVVALIVSMAVFLAGQRNGHPASNAGTLDTPSTVNTDDPTFTIPDPSLLYPTGPAGIVGPPTTPTPTAPNGTIPGNGPASTTPNGGPPTTAGGGPTNTGPPRTSIPMVTTTDYPQFRCTITISLFSGQRTGSDRRVKVGLALSTNAVRNVWVEIRWNENVQTQAISINPSGTIEYLIYAPGNGWPTARVFAASDLRPSSQMCNG